MKASNVIGIVLIIAGALGFVFGGIPYTEKSDIELGPIEIEASHEETLPIAPIASALLLVGGIGVIIVGQRSN